jgi:hypothetical protein
MITFILAAVIGILIIIIVALMFSSGRNDNAESDLPHPPAQQDLNTTLTPNTVINQTAPLEKGRKKRRTNLPPDANESAMAQAGKDETFLPQTTTTANDHQDMGDDALTGSQSKN